MFQVLLVNPATVNFGNFCVRLEGEGGGGTLILGILQDEFLSECLRNNLKLQLNEVFLHLIPNPVNVYFELT